METPIKKTPSIISLERENADKLLKENKALKQKVDSLEKENMLLKKSIYDLSVKYTAVGYHQKIGHFSIFDLEEPIQDGGKEIKEINLENSTGGYTIYVYVCIHTYYTIFTLYKC